jgi:hypothetical protein
MITRIIQFPLLVLLAAAGTATAATNYVVQGATNFQATIDTNQPGDYLVVQGGSPYYENLTFSKPITVLRSGTNLIQLQGTVQIQGTGSLNFAQCQFGNTVNMQCTGTVSFSQCTFLSTLNAQSGNLLMGQSSCTGAVTANLSAGGGTNFQAFDTTFSAPNPSLSLTGGKAVLKRCFLSGLNLSGSASLDALRLTNNFITSASAPNGSTPSFVAVQSSLADFAYLNNYKVWLGYNNISYGVWITNCDAVLVGNKVVTPGGSQYAGSIFQGGNLKAYNNVFSAFGTSTTVTMFLQSCAAELVNNTILGPGTIAVTRALSVIGGVTPVTVRACIFWNSGQYDADGNQPVNISYSTYAGGFTGSVGPCPTCVAASGVLDYVSFAPTAPCINAGPPEAIYNNRSTIDRNTIGWTGGPLYNPANFTNSNPMVFLLTGSPQNVFKGLTTNILVNAAASAGQ